MKKINEMTDAELQERIDFLKEIDSPSTAELCAELWNEKVAREKARKEREEKEKAEREKKLLADAEEAKKNKKELLRKQHNILGKYFKQYFKLGDGDVYYKVVGVVGNQAVLESVCKYQAGTYSSSYTSRFTRTIDSLLKYAVEVSEEEYLAQAGKSINLTENTKDLYDCAVDLYNDMFKDFNKDWRTRQLWF